MGPKKVIKPLVLSAVKVEQAWKPLQSLDDLTAFLSEHNMKRTRSKGRKRRLAKEQAIASGGTEPVETAQEADKSGVVIGLNSALRRLQEDSLGALIVDSKLLAPSAVAHALGLATLNKNCDFYRSEKLSETVSPLLSMPRVSAIGLDKDEPLTVQLKLCCEPPKPKRDPTLFQKPQFKTPVGKNKTKKKKQR